MVQGHLPDTSEISQIKPDFPHSLSDVMTFSSRLPVSFAVLSLKLTPVNSITYFGIQNFFFNMFPFF